jgi:hypothetical protein
MSDETVERRPVATESVSSNLEEARSRWLAASDAASKLKRELFQPGSGHGDPDALRADEHRLSTVKEEAERFFREYQDVATQESQSQLLSLKRANFVVVALVGLATILQLVFALTK